MKSENVQPLNQKQVSIFTAKQQYRGLTSRLIDTTSNLVRHAEDVSLDSDPVKADVIEKVSFSEIVRCAYFPFHKRSENLMREITQNNNLLTQYEWVIHKMSFAHSTEQVAASSDKEVFVRTTDDFTLQIKTDKSNSKQVYLLLSLTQTEAKRADKMKGVFLHCVSERQFHVLSFENVLDGQAQIMLEKEGKAYKLLTQPNAKLYLC